HRDGRRQDIDLDRLLSWKLKIDDRSVDPAPLRHARALRTFLSGLDEKGPAVRTVCLNEFVFLVEDEHSILCRAGYDERPADVFDSHAADRGENGAGRFYSLLALALLRYRDGAPYGRHALGAGQLEEFVQAIAGVGFGSTGFFCLRALIKVETVGD